MLEIFRDWIKRYFSDPQVVILGFLLLSGFVLVLILGDMLTPVFIGLIIAYLLEGMVAWLERRKTPRLAAVILVFTLFMACFLFLIIWLLPLLSRQIVELLQQLPLMITRAKQEIMLLPEKYPGFISKTQVEQILNYTTGELTKIAQLILSNLLVSVRGVIMFLVYLILVPLMVFFFLKDKDMILEWGSRFLPEERKLATEVWQEVDQEIGNYVRGKIWEILIVWGATYITFIWLDLPFALLLSLFVGLSVLVPYIGATVMFIPVGFIAFFEWGGGGHFAYTMIALGIIQALDGNLLVPLLLSGVVNIHPIAIIVAVLVFGGLWGMWGLFFAIPLATLFHAVIKAWRKSSQRVGESRNKTVV